MNKAMIVVVSILLILGVASPGFAQNKKINLNAENIRKASEVIKRNEALLMNQEMMERYQRLAKTLNKK
jgi:hypothetical protein